MLSTPSKQKEPLHWSSKSRIPVLSPKARAIFSPTQSSGSDIPLQCPYSPVKENATDLRLRLLSLLKGASTSSLTDGSREEGKTFGDARMKLSYSGNASPMSTPGRRKRSQIPRLRRPGDGSQSPTKRVESHTHGDTIDILRPVTRPSSRARSRDRRTVREEDSSLNHDQSIFSNDAISSSRFPSRSLEALPEATSKNEEKWSRESLSEKTLENASPRTPISEYGSALFSLEPDEPPSDDDIARSEDFLKALPKNPALRHWALHAMRNIRKAATVPPAIQQDDERTLEEVATQKAAVPDMTPFFEDSDSSKLENEDSEKENVAPENMAWSDDDDDEKCFEDSEDSMYSLFHDSPEPESSPFHSCHEHRDRRIITPNQPLNFDSVPPRRKKTRRDSSSSMPPKEQFDATQPFEIAEDEEEIFYTPDQGRNSKDISDDDEGKALSPLVTSERGKQGMKRPRWLGYYDEDLFENGDSNEDFGAKSSFAAMREPLEEIGAVPPPRFGLENGSKVVE